MKASPPHSVIQTMKNDPLLLASPQLKMRTFCNFSNNFYPSRLSFHPAKGASLVIWSAKWYLEGKRASRIQRVGYYEKDKIGHGY